MPLSDVEFSKMLADIEEPEKDRETVVGEVSKRLGVPFQWLDNIINFESAGGNPQIANPRSSAKGLIQFTDATAKRLGYGSSHELVTKNPTIESQMWNAVYPYLSQYKPQTEEDFYLSVFYPSAMGGGYDWEFPMDVQRANPGVRTPQDYINKVKGVSGGQEYKPPQISDKDFSEMMAALEEPEKIEEEKAAETVKPETELVRTEEGLRKGATLEEVTQKELGKPSLEEKIVGGVIDFATKFGQKEKAPVGTTAVAKTEPVESQPRIFTPETEQQVAEELFAGTGYGKEIKEQPEATIEGTIVRMFANMVSTVSHVHGFLVDVGQSISEKVIPMVQQIMGGIDDETRKHVETFNKMNFAEMQAIKNKYADQYKAAKGDEKIKALQRKIFQEVHANRMDKAREYAKSSGLDEEKFLDAVRKMPAGKQYALEITDIAYNNPGARFAKNLLEKYPSPQQVFGGGFLDTLKKSPIKGLQYMALSGLENMGNYALFAANAPAGLVAIGFGTAGQRAKELRDQDVADGKRLLAAAGYGLAESIPEMFGSAAIIGRLKDAFKTTLKEVGKDAAEKGIKELLTGMFKTGMKEWGVEFAEENVTSLSQIMTDLVTGVDTANAKERLKTYLTKEMPELLAATWTGGFAGAVRVSGPAQIQQIAKTLPTEKPQKTVITKEGVEVSEGFEKALGEEITKNVLDRTPEEIEREQDIAKAKAGELDILPATGGEIEAGESPKTITDPVTGNQYPVNIYEKAKTAALKKVGGEIKKSNEAQYDKYLKEELAKYEPIEVKEPPEIKKPEEQEEQGLPTPEEIETKQPSPEPQFNITEAYKDEIKNLKPEQYKPEGPKPLLESEEGSVSLSFPKRIGKVFKKFKSFLKEQIIAGGNQPKEVFEADLERRGWYGARKYEIETIINKFDKITDQVFGKRDLTNEETVILNSILNGETSSDKLPADLRNSIKEMRDYIDNLSSQLQDSGATSDDLNIIIESNKGIYLTRVFRKHIEGAKWAERVPQDVKTRAQNYLRNEIERNNEELLDRIGQLENKKREAMLPVTAVEQKMMEKGMEIEDSISKAQKKTDKEINKIKKNIEDNKKKLLNKAQFLNKRKTAIWRGQKVKTADQEYKSLKKQEKDIENKLAKIQEMDEINDNIVSIFDEMQGKLAEVQKKISLSPTQLPDIGEAITFFNNKIKKIDFAIKKLDKVEQEQIQKVRDIIEKDLVKTLNNINEERTAAWRSPDKDVEFQTKSIDERITELKDKIYEVDDETTAALVESILYTDKSIGKIITEGIPLGRKNIDILRKRKNLSEEMRALLGEVKDVRANFVNTSMKIADLISRQGFLNRVVKEGEGKFLFKKPQGEYIAPLGSKESKTYDPLAEYYTTPEIKKALYDAPIKDLPEWLKWWMKGIAITKYSKTILYPQTHSKNLFSNTGFAAVNGLWKIPFEIKNISKQFAQDKEGFTNFYKRLMELGVVGESARANELHKVFEEAQFVGADYLLGKRWQRKIRKALKLPEKAYAFEDDIWKILSFKAEYSDLKKAFPELSEQQLEEKTAEIIRLTWPTWSMTPKAIQNMTRFPLVGTFLSFQYQTMRTSINSLKLAFKEVQNPKTKSMGYRRLAGTAIYATALGSAAMAARIIHGITREEDKKIRKRVVPPWDRYGLLIYNDRTGNEISYLNASHYIPHQFAADAAIAIMKGDKWQDKLINAFGETFEPYISPDIFTEKMLELRDNEKKTGGKVFLENSSGGEIAKAVTLHFMDALEPGFVTSGRRVAKAAKGEETFWKKYTLKEEVPAAITGFRGRTVNLKSSFLSNLFKYRNDKDNLSRDRKKYGNRRSKELELDLYREFSSTIDDFIYLGMSPREINRLLKQYNISGPEIDALNRKTYSRRVDEKYKKLRREGK